MRESHLTTDGALATCRKLMLLAYLWHNRACMQQYSATYPDKKPHTSNFSFPWRIPMLPCVSSIWMRDLQIQPTRFNSLAQDTKLKKVQETMHIIFTLLHVNHLTASPSHLTFEVIPSWSVWASFGTALFVAAPFKFKGTCAQRSIWTAGIIGTLGSSDNKPPSWSPASFYAKQLVGSWSAPPDKKWLGFATPYLSLPQLKSINNKMTPFLPLLSD
jgi:hypothetical protein